MIHARGNGETYFKRGESMAHTHPVNDVDLHFTIDPVTREIKNNSEKIKLMQYDHRSERFTFDLPRYIEEHDMSLCNQVQVHYINAGSNGDKYNGVAEITDLQIKSDDEDTVTCSWLITSNVTQYVGTVAFIVRYACVTDGAVDYIWNTGIYNKISIANGICNTGVVAEEYADILAEWEARITALENTTLEPATATTLGGIKVGANLSITEDGTLSADATSSWNDLTDKPFYDTRVFSGEPLNITWDGNTTGKVADSKGYSYKVSDLVLDKEQLVGITYTDSTGYTGTFEEPEDWDWNVSGDGKCIQLFGGCAIVIKEDNWSGNVPGCYSATFPEAGIYFYSDGRSLTGPAHVTSGELKQLDSKYIPDDPINSLIDNKIASMNSSITSMNSSITSMNSEIAGIEYDRFGHVFMAIGPDWITQPYTFIRYIGENTGDFIECSNDGDPIFAILVNTPDNLTSGFDQYWNGEANLYNSFIGQPLPTTGLELEVGKSYKLVAATSTTARLATDADANARTFYVAKISASENLAYVLVL